MKDKKDLSFDYQKLFGLPHSVGGPIFEDLLNKFSHAKGAFVAEDEGGRKTAFNLGQLSVIQYIISQLNKARIKSEGN